MKQKWIAVHSLRAVDWETITGLYCNNRNCKLPAPSYLGTHRRCKRICQFPGNDFDRIWNSGKVVFPTPAGETKRKCCRQFSKRSNKRGRKPGALATFLLNRFVRFSWGNPLFVRALRELVTFIACFLVFLTSWISAPILNGVPS